jgi:hypothetical protein
MSSDEGLIFTDPNILLDSQVTQWLHENFPDANNVTYSEIVSYYPIPLLSSGRYLTEFDRLEQLISGYLPTVRNTNLQKLF